MNFDYVPNGTKINTSKRCPIVLCLEVSPSMKNNCMELLNKMIEAIENEVKIRNCAEIAVVTFGSDVTESNFEMVDFWKEKNISADKQGKTSITVAVKKSIELLKKRINELNCEDIDHYLPLLVVATILNEETLIEIETIDELCIGKISAQDINGTHFFIPCVLDLSSKDNYNKTYEKNNGFIFLGNTSNEFSTDVIKEYFRIITSDIHEITEEAMQNFVTRTATKPSLVPKRKKKEIRRF